MPPETLAAPLSESPQVRGVGTPGGAPIQPSLRRRLQIACWIVLLTAGCQPKNRSGEYVPPEAIARNAVAAALADWQQGRPAGPIAGTTPQVQVVDTHRAADQELAGYDILGSVGSGVPRCFAVKLQLKNPEAEERVRFVVVGIDPLWVFRQEDYDMLAHWDMVMPPETPPAEATVPDAAAAEAASDPEPARE